MNCLVWLCWMNLNGNQDQVGPLLESCLIHVYCSLLLYQIWIDLCKDHSGPLKSQRELHISSGFSPYTDFMSRTSKDIPCFWAFAMFDQLVFEQVNVLNGVKTGCQQCSPLTWLLHEHDYWLKLLLREQNVSVPLNITFVAILCFFSGHLVTSRYCELSVNFLSLFLLKYLKPCFLHTFSCSPPLLPFFILLFTIWLVFKC